MAGVHALSQPHHQAGSASRSRRAGIPRRGHRIRQELACGALLPLSQVKKVAKANTLAKMDVGFAAAEKPMQQRIAKGLDRVIDEMFLAYDRITKPGVKRST